MSVFVTLLEYLMCVGCVVSLTITGRYRENIDLFNKLEMENSNLHQFKVSSLIYCASICREKKTCYGFGFHEDQKFCQLKEHLPTISLTVFPGMRNFCK